MSSNCDSLRFTVKNSYALSKSSDYRKVTTCIKAS